MGYVTVKVEGDDRDQVNGVAAGVMVGLENTGFKNVRLAVEYEAKDMEAVINRDRSLDAPSTMLATLKMRNPGLFEQPVMVHVPVVNPTGGLTVFQTADNRIIEEKDDSWVPPPSRAEMLVQEALKRGTGTYLIGDKVDMRGAGFESSEQVNAPFHADIIEDVLNELELAYDAGVESISCRLEIDGCTYDFKTHDVLAKA